MRYWVLAALAAALGNAAFAGGVVATVKPLHSLVAAVMDGDVQGPVLLVGGRVSPHTFQLAPSQMSAAQGADVVFAIGGGLEPFLPRLKATFTDPTQLVVMADQPGMFVLPMREGAFDDADAAVEDVPPDPHLWMDPQNAVTMVDVIVKTLGDVYPQQAVLYQQNGEALKARIKVLDGDIRSRMQPLAARRFIVFHDALHYFEHAYGLRAADAIALAGEPLPGAQHLSHLRALLESGKAVCVLREPESGRLPGQLAEGTPARLGLMDPEATQLDPGPKLYPDLLSATADQLEKCLK